MTMAVTGRMALALVVGALLAVACVASEAARAVVFGWIAFLWYVLPRVSVDRPTLILAAVTLVLLVAGVHGFGVAFTRRREEVESGGRRWTARWSLTAVALTVVAFAAGTCVVGIVHQTAWLLTDEAPLYGTAQTLPAHTLRASGPRSGHQLRWIGLAANNYHSSFGGSLPPGGTFDAGGEMLHSWETHLLPFIGYGTYGIDMNRPWNDEGNAKYFRCVVPQFINPELRTPTLTDADGFGLSHYAANARVMSANRGMKFSEITDGANTILIGEVNANCVPWGHPFNFRDPAKGINRSPDGFGGARFSGGANFVMADGSVRFVSERVNQGVLRALATPGGRDTPERGPAVADP
jgi:prepilin-type processing-associated H-X9-DG protein